VIGAWEIKLIWVGRDLRKGWGCTSRAGKTICVPLVREESVDRIAALYFLRVSVNTWLANLHWLGGSEETSGPWLRDV
jgi:hypothetical protein